MVSTVNKIFRDLILLYHPTCTWHTDVSMYPMYAKCTVDHAHERTSSGSVSFLFKSQWPLHRFFGCQSGRKEERKQNRDRFFICRQTNILRRGDGYSAVHDHALPCLPRVIRQVRQRGRARVIASVPRRRSPRSDFCYTIMRCPWNCECARWPAGDWPHYPKETLTAVHSPPLLSEKVWWKKWERRTKSERRHDGDDVSECEREGGRETIAPRLVPIYRALKSLFWGKESKSLLKS